MADDDTFRRIDRGVDDIDAPFAALERFRVEFTGALRREIRTQTWQLTAALIGALTTAALFIVVAVLVVRMA
jgi:hypothetical protein